MKNGITSRCVYSADFHYIAVMALRTRSAVDSNQSTIVKSLRMLGVTVKPVHQLKGFCDIVAGYMGKNYLFEIKDPDKVPSKRKLTEDEQKFHDTWRGSVHIIHTVDEAWDIIQADQDRAPSFADKLSKSIKKK